MILLILRRLVIALVMIVLVSMLTFVLTALAPGDPATAILGASATPARVAALREQLGLNQPLVVQYGQWLVNALHGDFGQSLVTSQNVGQSIAAALPVTVSLVIGGTLFSGLIGVAIGMLSAVRGGWLGRLVDTLATLGLALPNFWLGWILVAVFAVGLHVLPATGYVSLSSSPSQWLGSLVLPVLTLGAVGVTGIAKQTRDSLSETLSREYVSAWRTDGVPEHRIVLRHVLRNAAIPILTIIGLYFIGMLSGTVIVESVFAMPGLGSMAVSAARSGDIPVIQGVVVVLCIGVVIANLLLDLAYVRLNPKERMR
jgi:peptide/nickel transport system permease protein